MFPSKLTETNDSLLRILLHFQANIHSEKLQPVRYGMVRTQTFSLVLRIYFLFTWKRIIFWKQKKTHRTIPYCTSWKFQEWILATGIKDHLISYRTLLYIKKIYEQKICTVVPRNHKSAQRKAEHIRWMSKYTKLSSTINLIRLFPHNLYYYGEKSMKMWWEKYFEFLPHWF